MSKVGNRKTIGPERMPHNGGAMSSRAFSRAVIAAAMLPALPCSAVACADLQAEVETRIRSAGVTQFSVSVVDASASSPGKVVGTCERGAKKLMYTQAASNSGADDALKRGGKNAQPILTECRDGSVSLGGDCRK